MGILVLFLVAIGGTGWLTAVPDRRVAAIALASTVGLLGNFVFTGFWILPLQTGAMEALTFICAVVVPPMLVGWLSGWWARLAGGADPVRLGQLDPHTRAIVLRRAGGLAVVFGRLSATRIHQILNDEARALALEAHGLEVARSQVLAVHERRRLDLLFRHATPSALPESAAFSPGSVQPKEVL